MKIVADMNIPCVEQAFASVGSVELGQGRQFTQAQVADADILLVRSVTKVDSQLLDGSSVRFVGSATAGLDHIDQLYLQRKEIAFAHAAGSNARSVVEYVLAAICETGRHLERLLQGGTVGIVGYGHVGSALAALCTGFGIAYKVFDPLLEDAPNAASLHEVLGCDVVSLHCELTQQAPWPSFHLIAAAELALLQSNALLINASRGAVIDNRALLACIERTGLDTVLDVWEGEPAIDAELLANVSFGTAHIAGYSYDAKLAATYHLAREAKTIFGLESAHLFTDATELPAIELSSNNTVAQAIRAMISERYVVADDDARLRAATVGAEPANAAEAFDKLRKDYPVRRELWGSSVYYAGQNDAVANAIEVLGCTRQGASKQ
ncbi:MAG: 4-phosphoerythronate dehydrogenase [Halioglobus sp.]